MNEEKNLKNIFSASYDVLILSELNVFQWLFDVIISHDCIIIFKAHQFDHGHFPIIGVTFIIQLLW